MPPACELSVTLSPELAAALGQAVESGEYASGSEIIREALRDWRRRRDLLRRDHDLLRDLWAEGAASGPGRYEDLAAIKAEARRRLMEDASELRA